jgi:hypothetical protein
MGFGRKGRMGFYLYWEREIASPPAGARNDCASTSAICDCPRRELSHAFKDRKNPI